MVLLLLNSKIHFFTKEGSTSLLFLSVTVKLYNYYVITGDNLDTNFLKEIKLIYNYLVYKTKIMYFLTLIGDI